MCMYPWSRARHVGSANRGVQQGGYYRVGIQGGYNGWVIPVPTDSWKAEHMTAKRAPEAPSRNWSGWSCVQRPPASPVPTLRARSVPCRALPGTGPAPRLLAYMGEI